MGVKDPGVPPQSYEEIRKMVLNGLKEERKNIFFKSHPFKVNPPVNYEGLHKQAFKQWYPEMNQPGYNHKIHGNMVIPDYRVYQPDRAAKYNPDIRDYMRKLEAEGLKDPWIRNEVWRVDPHSGKENIWDSHRTLLFRGFRVGLVGALVCFAIKSAYQSSYGHEHHTYEWWLERETPDPNPIYNRIKPRCFLTGFSLVSKNHKFGRPEWDDVGLPEHVREPHYRKDQDPAII